MTETEFEHRSGCDVGQDSGHCHIRKVLGVMFFGHRDRTCRQELKAVFGHSLFRAQISAGRGCGESSSAHVAQMPGRGQGRGGHESG